MNNNQATLNKMTDLRLHGMAIAYRTIMETGKNMDLTTDEVVSYLVDSQWDEKHNRRLQRLTKAARFRYQAAIEELDFSLERNLEKNTVLRLADCSRIPRGHDIIGDPTIVDAIMDRLVFNSHRIEMKGGSVRKKMYGVD
jgi:DNA replication protein DnaC